MNSRAVIVLAWLALSGLVVIRDWNKDKQTATQELVGIWLLSIVALGVAELSDQLALLAAAFLAADVLIQPGKNAPAAMSATLASILNPKPPAAQQPANKGVLA